jgi:hypothetical protein
MLPLRLRPKTSTVKILAIGYRSGATGSVRVTGQNDSTGVTVGFDALASLDFSTSWKELGDLDTIAGGSDQLSIEIISDGSNAAALLGLVVYEVHA